MNVNGVVLWFIFLLCLFSQAVVIISTSYEHRHRTNELQQIKLELNKAQQEYANWLAELEYLRSLYIISQQAKQMGMEVPKKTLVIQR